MVAVEQDRKKKPVEKKNGWQNYHHSLLLFLHQFLVAAVVVVIVYSFGRRLTLLHFFLFSSWLDASGEGEERWRSSLHLSKPSIHLSIYLSLVSFFPFVFFCFFFFLFFFSVAYNENWHEKLEMMEEHRIWRWRRQHCVFFLFFCTVSFSLCLVCGKTHRRYFTSRASFSSRVMKNTEEEKIRRNRQKGENRTWIGWRCLVI